MLRSLPTPRRPGARSRRSASLLGALACAALALSACGGETSASESTQPIIVVDDGASGTVVAGSGDAESGSSAAPVDEEAKAREFADCMRDGGVADFPEPTINADGSVEFGIGPGAGGGVNDLIDDPDFESAAEECGSLLEGASFLPGGGDTTEFNDQLLEVAQCLRDQGLDVDDPDLSGGLPVGGGGGGSPFGDSFDLDDPAAQEALEACQDVFTAIPGAGE